MTRGAWFIFGLIICFGPPVFAKKKPMVKTMVTFTSIPAAAVLITPSGDFGMTPRQVLFEVPEKQCKVFPGIVFRWVSGAEKRLDDLTVCAGKTQTHIVLRPAEIEGLDKDWTYADTVHHAEIEQQRLKQETQDRRIRRSMPPRSIPIAKNFSVFSISPQKAKQNEQPALALALVPWDFSV